MHGAESSTLVQVNAAFQSRCIKFHLDLILLFFLGLFLALLTLFNLFFLHSSDEFSAGAPTPAQGLYPFGTSSGTGFRLGLCQSLCPVLKPTRQVSQKAQTPSQAAQSCLLRCLIINLSCLLPLTVLFQDFNNHSKSNLGLFFHWYMVRASNRRTMNPFYPLLFPPTR